ncbi:uncharacterized protein TRIREDRAFT_107525 [Trichoderma reesei QM6a]|uniref:Predicted protein n=1 Tax=Hypocrea jecorina (strain QM6a) TaxID=431241 RepID=G0RJU5_HYPJQ|nr:uncharacterized protein TRIREDRAFT_107525 [Trichoderma reesei QM6a]EGR48813.1 predicted protein [Trichoderma reesei QM6a]
MTPSHCTPTRASCRADAGTKAGAVPAASELRHARRRIQNRLNQRAHRSRARELRINSSTQPYRVHRWRLDDGRDDMPRIIRPTRRNNHGCSSVSGAPVQKGKSTSSSQSAVSIHSEQHPEPEGESRPHYHLLHLIHFNVLRGLSYNKRVVKPNALIECSGNASAQLKRVLPHLPEMTSSSFPSPLLCLPESLAPTRLQLSCPHSNWIDVFPFPQMRDNLIRWENYFSHAEFLTDLLGNLISCMTAPPPRTSRGSRLLRARAGRNAARQDGDEGHDCADNDGNYMDDGDAGDDAPVDRRGFILWGEPFHKDSWEVTPGFLRKWSWAVEGCGELIESTNRWRTARGETPLRMMLS